MTNEELGEAVSVFAEEYSAGTALLEDMGIKNAAYRQALFDFEYQKKLDRLNNGTSEGETYTLRDPLVLIDIEYNDMGEPPEYRFARQDASEHEIVSCGGDYVKQVFVPVSEYKQQLREQIDSEIETYTRRLLSESKPYSDMTNKELRALAVDKVLSLVGLSTPERNEK